MSTQDISKQDKWLQEILDSQGDYEQEVMSGHEADHNTSYKNCTKNPGHVQFINVNTFGSEHLPERYRGEQKLTDYVRAQADVTCLIKVSYVSPDRPETLPFYEYRDRSDFSRSASGLVYYVEVNTKEDQEKKWYTPCECQTCQRSGEPRSEWAKVWIITASHVVFDKSEAEACQCYFFYDNPQQKLTDCPLLTGHHLYHVWRNRDSDITKMYYNTHDVVWARKLQDRCDRHESLCLDLHQKYGPISHVVPDRVVEEKDDDRNKVQLPSDKSKDNGPTGHGIQDHLIHGEDCGKENSDDEEDEDNVCKSCDDDDDDNDDDMSYKPEHDLVIITSHPHGCSKMVTLGQVTHRRETAYNSFEYSTATCPGSSGAAVFVLGYRHLTYSPHSGHVRGQGPEQINRSGVHVYL